MATYREDMRRAWERINAFPTQRLDTRLGTIEYADRGAGVPLLVSHGVLGCHVDTVDGWWADLPGPDPGQLQTRRRNHGPKAFAPLFRLAYSADHLFWIFRKVMPGAYSRMMGRPKGYWPSAREAAAMANMHFPVKPRREGAVFDGFVSNLAADRFLFQQLAVPTLVINARDDTSLAPYSFAATAAGRIPGAGLVSIEAGGHWFLGHDAEVREAIGAFVHQVS